MITIEDVRAWLDEKNVPYEVMVDSATGNDVYIIKHHSEAAGIDYMGVIAVPPGRFMMVKRHHTADSYNYNVEGKNLIIVFWPENTTTDSIQHYLDFGFDRLDFMYRNLEKLEIAD